MYGRISIILSGLLLSITGVLAQDTVRPGSFMDSHLHRSMQMGILHPVLTPNDSTAYGLLDLSYAGERGNFHRAQEPFSRSGVQLHATGYNRIGRFRVAGDFRFERNQEDSLANLLSGGGFRDLYPYYYFATKHSHYIKQGFLAQARIDYELISNKLAIGLGLSHRTYWTAGTVDPRPKTELFKLTLSPGLSFSSAQTKAGLDLHWATGTEDIHVTYKNRNYGTGISDPTRIRYINVGYGTMSTLDTASLRKYNGLVGVSLFLKTEWQDWILQAAAKYSKATQRNSHDITKRRNYYTRSAFDLKSADAGVLVSKQTGNRSHQIGFDLSWQNGQDFNTALAHTNYLASSMDIIVDYSLHLNTLNRLQYELGIQWMLDEDYRKDGGQGHQIDYSIHTFGLSGSTHLIGDKQRYRLMLSPYYRHPGRIEASFPPTQLNVFSEAIAIPDHLYAGTKAAGLDVRLDYTSRSLFKSYESVFYVQYGHLRSIETTARKRNYLQAGIALVL